MLAIAQARVPDAQFRVELLFKVDIPSCNAVISIGKCLNYFFDKDNTDPVLTQLFDRIYHALIPEGVFIP
ncbi:hypothetical protein H6F88_01280 [Oculatella sp. FACHB-28]|uniref:hypothetical protein n=1 Tax=Oculatella sp. FACHB-28 TaxID=2692845 RepID=UPI0016869701|nr:hypothetical protein [Oculatella sp. FACHB-28]MBD2054673.1 hypothetical protein [Oculatella sp. FACHB-28]